MMTTQPAKTDNLIAENQRLRAELRRSHSRISSLMKQATTDELTGLLNRRGFLEAAEREIEAARLEKRSLTLIYIDLDGLKALNDRCGHDEGDALLIETAALLRRVFRSADPVARLGGDEFVVLARGFRGGVETIQQRIDETGARRLRSGEQKRVISLSIGIAVVDPYEARALGELLSHADAEMYAAKRRKRPVRRRASRTIENQNAAQGLLALF